MILENNLSDKQVQVKVIDRRCVVFDGTVGLTGDTLTVPEKVADVGNAAGTSNAPPARPDMLFACWRQPLLFMQDGVVMTWAFTEPRPANYSDLIGPTSIVNASITPVNNAAAAAAFRIFLTLFVNIHHALLLIPRQADSPG